MKTLILLRHAKSDWDDSNLKDFDRPLSARGRNDAAKIGKWLTKHHPADYALVSDAKRTIETFDLSGIACDNETPHALYLADQHTLQSAIQHVDAKVETLLIVGHNPGITDLANMFLNSNEGYLELKTANCAVFEFNVQSWENINRKNAELIDFASGKKLK